MPEIQNEGVAGSRSGPLDVSWISHDVGSIRAGDDSVVHVELRNTGTATWRSRDGAGVRVSYHWLDTLGNPLVWDSPRAALPHPVGPGTAVTVPLVVRAPIPPGAYVLAFDLVEEFQFWFSEIGCAMLEVPCTVQPRIADRRLGVVIHPGPGEEAVTREALAGQLEPTVTEDAIATAHLVAGCAPEPDWSSRVLDAHEEGFAAVGGAVSPPTGLRNRRHWAWLAPWHARDTRNPRFRDALLLPSLVRGLEPTSLNGWPAFSPGPGPQDQTETALFDGRIVIRVRPRSGRRRP